MNSRLIRIIFSLILLTGLISCGKKPINGHLDGRWQLMTIDYHENGDVDNPQFTYYDVSLHVLKLWKTTGEDGSFGPSWLGRFNQEGDSLFIRMIRMNKKQVQSFGLNDTIQSFGVETLTRKTMILNSDYARLEFRKF